MESTRAKMWVETKEGQTAQMKDQQMDHLLATMLVAHWDGRWASKLVDVMAA